MHEHILPRWEQRLVGSFVRTTMFRRRKAKTWGPPPRAHDIRFPGNNGAQLAGHWYPTPRATATVVLCHPDRRYAKLWWHRVGWVERLQGWGLNVLAFDFVQYGQSQGGSTYLYQDVIHAVDEARRRAPQLPLHVFGVSLGAFSAGVASPDLDVESLILESPYPDFGSWYDGDGAYGARIGRAAMTAFNRLFPRTGGYIRADVRIQDAAAKRILIVASAQDQVTAERLTGRVARGAPGRANYLVLPSGRHLELHRQPRFVDAVRETLLGSSLDIKEKKREREVVALR